MEKAEGQKSLQNRLHQNLIALNYPPFRPDKRKTYPELLSFMARSSKKSAPKKTARKAAPKAATKKAASRKTSVVTKKPATAKKIKPSNSKSSKPAKTLKAAVAATRSANGKPRKLGKGTETMVIIGNNHKTNERRLDPFIRGQKEKLLQLRDAMVDSMAGVAQDTLRARAEGSEASAFGMHQADAGSDAYDRDFALSLLSQEQDALYEIDEALKRIDLGTYGKCEMSGKPISHARLEAIPFARFTVECQSQLEKQNKATRVRQSVTSLFGLTDDESREGEEEEVPADTKD
jgi:RNA polymerase-binding transcription factor DksA